MSKNEKKIMLVSTLMFFLIILICYFNCSNSVDIALFGGDISSKMRLSNERIILNTTTPVRDDNAIFQGWYTNLSFNEKIDITKPIPNDCNMLIAKWDKCYLFTLVYNRQAFFGIKKDGVIHYDIPAGNYKITMLKDSVASIGNLSICSNSNSTDYQYGYPIKNTIQFSNNETKKSIIISENQYVEISVDSIFQFIRQDVDEKYVTCNSLINVNQYTQTNGISIIHKISLIVAIQISYLVFMIVAISCKSGKSIKKYIETHDNISINELSENLNIKESKIKLFLPFILGEKPLSSQYYFDKKQKIIVKGDNKINKESQRIIDSSGNPFIPSQIINILACGWSSTKLLINDKSKQFVYKKGKYISKVYKFSDVISYEVYENGKSQVQGRAGSALIGGAFFGIGGLIVGSSLGRKINEKCNDLKLIIRVNDFECPQIVITYLENVYWDKNDMPYKELKNNIQSVCSMLEYFLNEKKIEQNNEMENNKKILNKTNKEQLIELKDMLDADLITQEDYEQKKKQILGI